jgi:uncharacterized protein (DUF2252 family)
MADCPLMKWLAPGLRVPAELHAAGKAARSQAKRTDHAAAPDAAPRDALAVLRATDATRVPGLLPIRYGRMAVSPFTFYRGAAAVMAHDLAGTPVSGIRVQCCGDAHLSNFGGFATPERNVVFDVNDFDETAPGAWEWDVKRLAASVEIAGDTIGFKRAQIDAAVAGCLAAYRTRMAQFAVMSTLDVWYDRVDEAALAAAINASSPKSGAKTATSSSVFPDIETASDGSLRFVDAPPHVYHDESEFSLELAAGAFKTYARTLPIERRALFERFRFADVAIKVVGVGSVGTRCLIALFVAGSNDRLILQIKEAGESVLEPYAGRVPFKQHGERVVVGQHLLQFASDVFLGWTHTSDGHDYYVRQLRDLKTSADVDRMDAGQFAGYVALCGRALARAHAKGSGLAAAIAGYLGRGPAFDEAVARFARAYAEVNARDYAALLDAIKRGDVPVTH